MSIRGIGGTLFETRVMAMLCNSYTMGCPPVRGDNPQALANGPSYVLVEKTLYNYVIPLTSV